MNDEGVTPEFSLEVVLADLPRGGKVYALKPNTAECAAIAKRIGAVSVEKLEGDIRIAATAGAIKVRGAVRADLIRECVASLEETPENIDEPFAVEFSRISVEPDDHDSDRQLGEIEYHENPIFDAGEFLVQQLALAMEPFPRKAGAASLAEQYGGESTVSPFARLRDKLEKSEKKQ